ncbi:MAG: YdcF family protein [Planctomycetaceae bacterium]|nr:YdcF family protein [Planctomycetaceae bacterium]MCP4774598.1 YdcF family protein [Planctomycetaceae bacterium]
MNLPPAKPPSTPPPDHPLKSFWKSIAILLLLAVTIFTILGYLGGITMLEKTLTSLVMPIGLVWVGLITLTYLLLISRQKILGFLSLGCLLAITLGGNQFASNYLAYSLEAPFSQIDIAQIPNLDAVIVLGGGTSSTYNNRSQLGMAGDRVATAARLYHSGQVKKIICTGSQSFRASPEDLHPREEAKLILTEFGIPASAVILLEGENTSQEMNSLKSWIPEHINSPQPRVGLITSAWHLKRALRLAKSQGLEFEPIPSNFISGPVNPSPHWVIPSGDNLATTGRIFKEYLAAIVSR